jgi:DNA polymerase I
MSEHKLASTMQIPVKKAKDIIDRYFTIVPGVKRFLDALGNLGKSRGYIRTASPYRRMRWFPKWSTDLLIDNDREGFAILGEIERQSKNMPVQGSNGDIIKLALCNMQSVIDDNDYPVNILLSVYDEIQTECKEEFAEEWKVIMENIMIQSAKVVIKSIPVVVDCSINDCWDK